jgi:hypothetical protein
MHLLYILVVLIQDLATWLQYDRTDTLYYYIPSTVCIKVHYAHKAMLHANFYLLVNIIL